MRRGGAGAVEEGPVAAQLRGLHASGEVTARWHEIVAAPLEPDEDEGY
jgi:hypothetical protein